MNSVPNSDSEQCPESKLGWVHRVRTLGTGCKHTAPRPRAQRALGVLSWRTGRHVAGHALPCRGRVAVRTRTLVRHVAALLPLPLVTIQNCIATQSMPREHYASCRAHARPYRRPCHSTLLPCRSVVS